MVQRWRRWLGRARLGRTRRQDALKPGQEGADDDLEKIRQLTDGIDQLVSRVDSLLNSQGRLLEEIRRNQRSADDVEQPRAAPLASRILARIGREMDPLRWARTRAYWAAALRQMRDWLADVGLPPVSLFFFAFWFVLAVGIAYTGWREAPNWFPNSEGAPLPINRTNIGKALAIGTAVLVILVTAPLWFQRAKQLRPILVPAFLLAVIVLVGGAAVLLEQPHEPSEAEGAYLLAMGAGLVSVLAASVKWAFDMIGVSRETIQKRNEAMANRVESMINEHYAPMVRLARDVRESLRHLHQLSEFPEPSAIKADRDLANQTVVYRFGLFLLEERRLFRERGAIFLASRRLEERVTRLLVVTHLLLGLEPENEEQIIREVQDLSSPTARAGDAAEGSGSSDNKAVSFPEFLVKVNESDRLKSIVGILGHRLEGPRILVGLALAISEFRSQLLTAINDIHRDWYEDWQPSRPPPEYSLRERQTKADWAKLLRELRSLSQAVRDSASDVAEGLVMLADDVRNAFRRNDPVAIFALHEDRLEDLLGQLVLRFRGRKKEIEPLLNSMLNTIGSKDEARNRFSRGWIEAEDQRYGQSAT